jgi:hypothetical protein
VVFRITIILEGGFTFHLPLDNENWARASGVVASFIISILQKRRT